MKGEIFDLEEFALFDGPGIRCALFLKGCPLRCAWCHNPEGLTRGPQRVVTHSLCAHCGTCDAVCPSPCACTGCLRCAKACPKGCIRIAGETVESEAIAERIAVHAPLLRMNGGGVTFSGGEPLLQAQFVLDVRRKLPMLHACIETSGYASAESFQRVAAEMDLVILDIKLIDPDAHRRYTGVGNAPILRNLRILQTLGVPYRIRVPLIPGVNDTRENLRATAALLQGAECLEKVELLPYHRAAGAKYASLGRRYTPTFREDVPPEAHIEIWKEAGIPCEIL